MNLFLFVARLQGLSLKAAQLELNRIQESPLQDFLSKQEEKKWEIFHHHLKTTNFYRKLIQELEIHNWQDIRILQKSDFQKPLTDILASGYPLNHVYTNNTSGSTGQPFHFAKDKFSHALTWAYILDRYKNLGLEYGKSLQARFSGIPLTRAKFQKEKLKDFISARVRFPVFDLSDRKLEEYLKKFYKHKFEYIYGYTSSLVLFAQFLKDRNIRLKDICPTLKWCICTSEVCSPEDRNILQKSFGVNVINEYGAAELDILAFEDKEGDWLLNEENLFIEIIGDDGKPVKEGEEGRVVVTSLYNKAMPFIRYDLGDIVSLYPERKGIHRKIKTMQGRVNDVADLPSGKKSPGLTFYYVSKSLLEEGGFLKEFIIKQLAPDHFHFEYVATNELTDLQKAKVREVMDLYLEPRLKATFERKEKIERTASGKFKHFQNLIGLNASR